MFYVHLLAAGPHPSHLLKLRMPNREPGLKDLSVRSFGGHGLALVVL